jgi:cell division protease FtsH
MDTKSTHIELIARKQELEQATRALKKKFLGLDEIIDEVISQLMPWYLFPKAQLRPTVINLWGLTGSGKTALVQTLVELLQYQKLYSHIDMGEFESDSASWMKNILTDDLSFFHEKSPVICLDEFQFARTLDNNGNELGKDKLRVIWDLLDSGKIQYIPRSSTYYLFRADNCLKRLEKLMKERVALKDGIVANGVDHFVKTFEGFYFDYNDGSDAVISPSYFVTDDFVSGMFHLFDDDDFSKEQLRARIKSSTLEELIILVKQGMHTRPASKTLDLSHSLMFVLGNLDEAYSMSHNMNPDICADEFHEATAKITIADIKRALRKRFRPEQIARLGNNHIIYKSFNCAQFRALIRQELRRIETFVRNQFGWKVIFDESVVNIVYAEGVFPAQGTRPVFTTVKNLVESRVSSLVVSILEYQLEPALINWKFDNDQFVYEVLDEKSDVVLSFFDQAKLKLENLRRSVDPQIQAHTAVHEAGHAVLAALTLRIIPSVVVSRTASDMEGFCLVNFPKGPMTNESLKKDIVITLGGYVAEKMIFGEKFTSSGVYSDIEEASRLANKAVRNYAMGSDPIHLAIGTQNEDAFTMSQKYSAEAVTIIKECEVEAERLLQHNKLLLLKIADYLTTHSRMEEQMILSYVKQFSAESWIETKGFLKKDEYYQFNTILQSKLLEEEKENFPVVIEEMIIASEEANI